MPNPRCIERSFMQTALTIIDQPQTATLRDEERQPCEVWTRVMGYYPPGVLVQSREAGRISRTEVFR